MAERRHMPDDVHRRGIALGALAIAAAIGLGLFAAWAAVHFPEPPRTREAQASAGQPPSIAGPVVLQPAPASDLARFRAAKAALLHGYAWVDAGRGIARIPIERAMALAAHGAVPAGSKP